MAETIYPARPPLVLLATASAAFVATSMATGINVALPSMVTSLSSSFPVMQWVVLSYLLATIALLPIVGRLGDMLGKQRVFLAGYATYLVGSVACALAPDAATLIAFRALQGAGSAALTALSLAIVTDAFPPAGRGRALGLNGAVISLGIVIGPSLGGLLTDLGSWRWVFAAAAIAAVPSLLLSIAVLPRYPRRAAERFDLPGAASLVTALLSLSLGLTLSQQFGIGDGRIVTAFVVAVAGAAAFLAIQRRSASPLVDLRVFRDPGLSIGLASGFTTFVSISGVIFLMPFYLGGIRGLAPSEIGVLMAVVPIVLVVMAPIAGAATDRFGARPVTVVGIGLVLIGYLAVGTLEPETTAVGYLLRFLPVGLGMGTFQTPNNVAIMSAGRRAASGVTGSLLGLTRFLGQIVGTVGLGSLWAIRAASRAGESGVDATTLPVAARMAALHDVLVVVQVLIAGGLLLVVVDLLRSRRGVVASPPHLR
jgi:EmrB/QacA subfamily drug resistance transporter